MKAIKPDVTIAAFPTTVPQKRCWAMEQHQPGHRGLNLAIRWEVRGDLPGDVIERAFQAVIARHEILRTRFVERDGAPVQEVVETVDFRLTRVDLRNLPEAAQEPRIREIAREHAAEPFDLSRPCQFRVALVQMARDRAALLIGAHSAIFDGYSIAVLGHEMGTIAAALLAGRPHGLPDLPLQYGDYAMWLRDCEAAGALAEDEAYWLRQLEGMTLFELPPDRARSAGEPQSQTVERALPADFDARMAAAARAMDVSVFALGAAAASAALERFSGRQDVSFATQAAGRNDLDLEPLIGVFTNPLVLRLDVRPDKPLADHIAAARDVIDAALAHENPPFDRLVQRLDPRRDALVSVMFNLQRAFLDERSYGPFAMRPVPSQAPGTLYDLNIDILGWSSGWRLAIDYDANLFDAATIEGLADLLEGFLSRAIEAPETPVAATPAVARQDARAEPMADAPAAPEGADSGTIARQAAPALAGLAGVVEPKTPPEDAGETRWSLVELRAGTARPVLVTINQTFLYQAMAREIAADSPVANIAVPDSAALASVGRCGFDAACEEAAALIAMRYGGRPLLLAGMGIDGRAALRIAQALAARGQDVALVAMIDTWAPGAVRAFSRFQLWRDEWTTRVRRLVYLLQLRRRGRIGTDELMRQYGLDTRLLRRVGRTRVRPDFDALIEATVALFVAQTRGYRFEPYSGEALMFLTEAHGLVPADGLLGWHGLLPADTASYSIEGWQGDALVRPGFKRVTQVLDERLRRLALRPPRQA